MCKSHHTRNDIVSVARQDPEEVEAALLEKEEEVEAVEELLSAEQVCNGYGKMTALGCDATQTVLTRILEHTPQSRNRDTMRTAVSAKGAERLAMCHSQKLHLQHCVTYS